MRYNAQARFIDNSKRGVPLDQLTQHIGLRLKSLRQQKGWSLDKTALETNVSKAMLGQIERMESSPSVSTLWKIASGFHMSFSSFLEESPALEAGLLYRQGTLQPLSPPEEKIRVTPVFPFDKELNFELLLIELLPGCEQLSAPHEPGVIEHLIILKGSLEILVNGEWQLLKEREALRFDAHCYHGYRNVNEHSALFHNIIHYPLR